MRRARLYLKYLFIAHLSIVIIGCGSNSVKKAKEFMKAGMYPQAIELLNKKIGEEPSDPEAHFLMGVCNIYTNDFGQANERFGSAVRLKSDYGFQIGSEYKKAGNEALSKNISRALDFYREAINYQPALKDEISTELMTEGKSLFEKGQHPSAGERFMTANAIKPELGPSIAEYYFKAGNKPETPMELKEKFFDIAYKFNPKNEYQQAKNKIPDEIYAQAQKIEIHPAGLMPMNERQSSISQLEQKASLLKKTGNRYGAEYQAVSERLELEKNLVRTIGEKGEPRYCRIENNDTWKKVCTIKSNDKIYYLSSASFKLREPEGVYGMRMAKDNVSWIEISGKGEIPIEFSSISESAEVYFWIENI